MGIFVLTLIMAYGIYTLFSTYFASPQVLILKNEIREMQYGYEQVQGEVKELRGVLRNIEQRDDNIYRTVLGAEPIEKSVRDAGIGGTDRYADIRAKNMSQEDLIIEVHEQIDQLRRKIYIESKSQDEVVQLAEKKEKLYAAIPAIQPISNKQLVAIASGFGFRIHPVYKLRKMHTGIDFAATIGTPIYATADGKIDVADVRFSGYGKVIEIDHGFGYRTRYAHMHEFAVHPGQAVKRGDLIGYVGNTGLSTAPHLHYEVFINGTQVDPVHYFYNDLSAGEYAKVLELASVENQSLGM
jgi:murein DD-endopeptidase MepM/ murein hydrolase activator NlpD